MHDKYSDEIHGFLEKTINHIQKMYDALSDKVAFGREDVQHATGLKPTRASMLIKELVKRKILEPVSGYGKGSTNLQEYQLKDSTVVGRNFYSYGKLKYLSGKQVCEMGVYLNPRQ